MMLGTPAKNPGMEVESYCIKVGASECQLYGSITDHCVRLIEEYQAKYFTLPGRLVMAPAAARQLMNECNPSPTHVSALHAGAQHGWLGRLCGVDVYVRGNTQ